MKNETEERFLIRTKAITGSDVGLNYDVYYTFDLVEEKQPFGTLYNTNHINGDDTIDKIIIYAAAAVFFLACVL